MTAGIGQKDDGRYRTEDCHARGETGNRTPAAREFSGRRAGYVNPLLHPHAAAIGRTISQHPDAAEPSSKGAHDPVKMLHAYVAANRADIGRQMCIQPRTVAPLRFHCHPGLDISRRSPSFLNLYISPLSGRIHVEIPVEFSEPSSNVPPRYPSYKSRLFVYPQLTRDAFITQKHKQNFGVQ